MKEALKEVEERIILHSDSQQDVAPLLTRIQEIDQAMSNLLLLVSHSADSGIYDAKFKELTREKADLQAQVDAVEQAARQDQGRRRELQAVMDAIDRQPVELERYDDELVRRIVEKITVIPADEPQIAIQFKLANCTWAGSIKPSRELSKQCETMSGKRAHRVIRANVT